MSFTGRRVLEGSEGGRTKPATHYLNGQTVQGILIATISIVMFWLVWIYGNALRDPRYLDGWLLAGGMCLQFFFHVAIKTAVLPPKWAVRSRKFHIFLGYILIAAFISHAGLSLPDTIFEWALWIGFVLVTLSGILGIYFSWSLKTRHGFGERASPDLIRNRRPEMAREVHAIVTDTSPYSSAPGLPAPPYDQWIKELYTTHLKDFFKGPRNFPAHLAGSRRPLKRLMNELDHLSPYMDKRGQQKLATIKKLVLEKDEHDFADVYLGLAKCWIFVHVPATYALIVLTVAHVLVVYAFSSGAW